MAPQVSPVNNRKELFDVLEQQMNNAYGRVRDIGSLGRDGAYVKTYLLEFDWQPKSLKQSEVAFLIKALTLPPSRNRKSACRPIITETLEDGFFQVTWKCGSTGPLSLYIDTKTDEKRRFWIAYSLSDAAEIDTLLERLTMAQSSFDRVWLWPSLLNETQEKGEFRGVGMDYDYRRFEMQSDVPDSTKYLKLQIWGGKETKQILDYLDASPEFSNQIVLSKVRMKFWPDQEEKEKFSIEDIKYNGKFTTRGTSFDAHQSLVIDLRSIYEQKIIQIENEHTIHHFDGDARSIQGDPVFFNFSQKPIENLDLFCKTVFSGHLPFRLWGVVKNTAGGDDGRIVSAVDLHTGSKLFFEIYPDLVSIYIYPGACGNTVARFFTNIQQTFSRNIVGENIHGESIF